MAHDTVKLKSRDGRVFSTRRSVADQILFVKAILDDVAVEPGFEIPLSEVRGDILERVLEYCEFSMEEKQRELTIEQIDEWERKFIDMDHPTLYRLILAANFLDVQSLLDLLCKCVADQIKGKTTEQIRETFKMDPRFTD